MVFAGSGTVQICGNAVISKERRNRNVQFPMATSPTLAKPKTIPKTLVIGSIGHAHVQCVAWTELKSVNLKDFDVVVANVASLDDKTMLRIPPCGDFREARTEFSRLLYSGGNIIAITPERRRLKQKDDWRDNWEWCPCTIGTQCEVGDTIQVKRDVFSRYLSKLRRWTFYFFVPQDCLTIELINVFGSPNLIRYQLPADSYLTNRYSKMLAGEVPLLISSPDGHNSKHGSIILLPSIDGLERAEAVNLVLVDLLGKPQQSVPPDWVGKIQMPFVDHIDADIAQKNAEIESLRRDIAQHERKRASIERWKRLIYATGHELEQVFEESILNLGAKTAPAGAEEEFTFEHNSSEGVVECKGVGKSISLDHVRQADSHVIKFAEATGRDGKGILFGNAWRTLPPEERDKPDTVIFPDNVIKYAAQRGIALVGAVNFLEAFRRFLKAEVTGGGILDAIMTQSGVVDFQKIKT